jgi:hypothetical protein
VSRILRSLLAGVVCALGLASCDILFNGAYSTELAQSTALADLSGSITAAAASTFNLSILRSGGNELVLLYSTAPFDGTQSHLLVLSPDLKVLNAFTADDIRALAPAGVPFKGDSALAHLADGRIVIGNVEAAPSASGLSLLGKLNTPANPVDVQLSGWTIVGPSSADFTWSNFRVDSSNVLTWSVYSSSWSTASPVARPLGKGVQLSGVFTDPESAQHNIATLVFSDGSSDTLYFIRVPKNPDLVNGLYGPPLFDNPAYPAFVKQGLGSKEIYMTSDSIIGFEGSSQSWVRFAPSSPDLVTRLPAGKRGQGTRSAFSFSGGYYCTWNPETRTLVRNEKWW